MTICRPPIRTLTLLLWLLPGAVPALSQTVVPQSAPAIAKPVARKPKPKTDQPTFNSNVILLDAAHGGSDNGAKLGEDSLEKDATFAFAGRLKTLLVAHGFTVILTRDSATADVTPDARVEIANRSRAVACVLLHASNAGHGVHLYSSSLIPAAKPAADADDPRTVQPWGSAQAAWLALSQRLAGDLSNALYAVRFPLVVGRASMQPIDSMSCPAVAIELSPVRLVDDSNGQSPASDAGYQQRVAEALAAGLGAWRGHAEPHPAGTTPAAPTVKPTPPVRAPKPKTIPVETPDVVSPVKAKAPPKVVQPAAVEPPSGGTPP